MPSKPDKISEVYNVSFNRFLKRDEARIRRAGLFFPVSIVERIKIKIENLIKKKISLTETLRLISFLSLDNRDIYFVERKKALTESANRLEKL